MIPTPADLHKQTGGGDSYRVAMLEYGYVEPTPPGEYRNRGKQMLQCGNLHELNWSKWRRYRIGGYEFEGRWCQTCATTQAREVERCICATGRGVPHRNCPIHGAKS